MVILMSQVEKDGLNLFLMVPVKFLFQDDPPAMDFVTAAANLRMHIFSMNMKSRFDVKCKLSLDSVTIGIYCALT